MVGSLGADLPIRSLSFVTEKGTVYGPYGNDTVGPEDFPYWSPNKVERLGMCRLQEISGGAGGEDGALKLLSFMYMCAFRDEDFRPSEWW